MFIYLFIYFISYLPGNGTYDQSGSRDRSRIYIT